MRSSAIVFIGLDAGSTTKWLGRKHKERGLAFYHERIYAMSSIARIEVVKEFIDDSNSTKLENRPALVTFLLEMCSNDRQDQFALICDAAYYSMDVDGRRFVSGVLEERRFAGLHNNRRPFLDGYPTFSGIVLPRRV